MEFRNLGRSGVKVSTIGIGCNQFGGKVDKNGTRAIIHRALDEGINFFDTANVYNAGRSEEFVGAGLKGQWDKVVIATKFRFKMGEGPNDIGASRYHIMNAVEASLLRLGTDHIDLYQIHRWDDAVPIDETMRALDDLIRAGKVCYIGASQFSAWQLGHSNDIAGKRGWNQFITVQAHHHLLERDVELELLPYCKYAHVGFLPYYPLAGGFLTGKYERGNPPPEGSRGEKSPYVQNYLTDEKFDGLEKLRAFAESHGRTLHALAFAWLLNNELIPSVIAGVTNPDQVTMNASTTDWVLSQNELDMIDKTLEG